MTRRNIVLNRIRDRENSSAFSRELLSATKHARVEIALRDVLERLIETDMFAELEAGCDGEGPVVRGPDGCTDITIDWNGLDWAAWVNAGDNCDRRRTKKSAAIAVCIAALHARARLLDQQQVPAERTAS